MFETIFIENELKQNPRVDSILSRFKNSRIKYLERYDSVWGRVKKPYLSF